MVHCPRHVAESFIADGFQGQIKNDIIGTGAGFKRFCGTGETDISNASRPIKDSEKADCLKLTPSRNPIAFTVAIDGIAVVVSKQNTFLKDVTLEQLAKIFGDKNAIKWSDINPEWPAEDIQRFTPGTDSGTFDYFVEDSDPKRIERLRPLMKPRRWRWVSPISNSVKMTMFWCRASKAAPTRSGTSVWLTTLTMQDKLNAVSINGLLPTQENAEAGTYALARPLFIYSDAAILKAKPQVAAFIKYYLDNVNQLVTKVGYFPAKQSDLDASMQALMDALK